MIEPLHIPTKSQLMALPKSALVQELLVWRDTFEIKAIPVGGCDEQKRLLCSLMPGKKHKNYDAVTLAATATNEAISSIVRPST